MNKLTSLTSEDLVAQNIATLKQLFPTIVKEGEIDFKELEALLKNDVVDGDEYYRFTWAGKSQARLEANKPSTGTLRPDKESSKNWDTTKNIFIEGDNLEVLKLLQKSYANRIKMIYIDPPYNTGKDFVYKDNYTDNLGNYLAITGQTDEEGKKLSTNTESDGRYHSNWLNMMYPRLRLARNLMTDDGVIFISIDDNEIHNLKKLCDEIFGEESFIADITVVNNLKGRNDKKYIATANEKLLMYVRTDEFQEHGLSLPEDKLETYSKKDKNGKFRLIELRKRGGADTRAERPNMYYPFYLNPEDGNVSLEKNDKFYIEVLPKKSNGVDGRWRWGVETATLKLGLLVGKPVQGGEKYNIYEKDYLEQNGELRRIKPKSVMSGADYSTDVATKKYRSIMGSIDFTNPKPIEFIKDLVEYSVIPQNKIILDFYSGSGTTAHAVMQLNAEDGGNRQCISVQLPELTDESSEAFKAGYSNIAEITKERIRRAGEKIVNAEKENLQKAEAELSAENAKAIKDENLIEELASKIQNLKYKIQNLDIGFKAFKLDSSNIRPWDGNPENLEDQLFTYAENIKENRTEEDILFEVLLKYGLDLTVPIEEKSVAGKTVYNIGAGTMFICLADNITPEISEAIGQWKEDLQPAISRVIFKDSGFATDKDKTNAVQILKRFGIEEANSI